MVANILQILILGLVQGAAELLPISSSAHVIVVEKLMGLDASSPEMTFLLVMLHTGTMFAVIVYFWNAWRLSYFSSAEVFWKTAKQVIVATVLTAIIGLALQQVIEKVFLKGSPNTDVETLFSQLPLIGAALLVAGLLIIVAGLREPSRLEAKDVSTIAASWIGAVQGLCLPFRGFSRSGATISTGLLLGVGKRRMEEFSFALAVGSFGAAGLARHYRDGGQLCCRTACVAALITLARDRTLEAVRRLLYFIRGRCFCSRRVWFLKPLGVPPSLKLRRTSRRLAVATVPVISAAWIACDRSIVQLRQARIVLRLGASRRAFEDDQTAGRRRLGGLGFRPHLSPLTSHQSHPPLPALSAFPTPHK